MTLKFVYIVKRSPYPYLIWDITIILHTVVPCNPPMQSCPTGLEDQTNTNPLRFKTKSQSVESALIPFETTRSELYR